jgi:hypothetical protein
MSTLHPDRSAAMRTLDVTKEIGGAPVALRFWDQALGLPVTDSLMVTIRAADGQSPRVAATRAGGNWLVFRNLPGLADTNAAPHPYLIEVFDLQRRFLPVLLPVSLPGPPWGATQGLNQPGAPQGEGWLLLYSAPTRREQPGLGMITGQLVDVTRPAPGRAGFAPAGWAMLSAAVYETGARDAGAATYRGIADERGCFSLHFPYPVILPPLSPASRPGGAPPLYEWDVTLSVRYRASDWSGPAGAIVPDLRTILGQPAAPLYPTQAGPPAESLAVKVCFGKELILKTDERSELLIANGTSTPT